MNLLKNKKELFDNDMFSDWGKYMKFIRQNSYREDVNKLLNGLKTKVNQPCTVDDISSRRFISAFTMIKFDMFDKNDTKDVELYYKSSELLKSFENVFDNNLNNELIISFFKSFTEYLDTFKQWKEKDEKALAEKHLTQQYKEIQVMEQKFAASDSPADQQLSHSSSMLKRVYEKQIRQIGGDNMLNFIHGSPKLKPIDVIHLDMGETMKNAYWDMFEEDINKNNLEPIGKNLDEFRGYLFKLLGESNKAKEIQAQFDNEMDIDIVKQMIQGSTLTSSEIFNIIQVLTSYVKKYVHSASEDKDTEILVDNIYKKFNEEKEPIGSILRYFFQNIFIKLDNTNTKLQLLKL